MYLSLGVVQGSKHCNRILLIVVTYCTITLLYNNPLAVPLPEKHCPKQITWLAVGTKIQIEKIQWPIKYKGFSVPRKSICQAKWLSRICNAGQKIIVHSDIASVCPFWGLKQWIIVNLTMMNTISMDNYRQILNKLVIWNYSSLPNYGSTVLLNYLHIHTYLLLWSPWNI